MLERQGRARAAVPAPAAAPAGAETRRDSVLPPTATPLCCQPRLRKSMVRLDVQPGTAGSVAARRQRIWRAQLCMSKLLCNHLLQKHVQASRASDQSQTKGEGCTS